MNNDAWFEPLQQQTPSPDAEARDAIPDVEPGTSEVEAGPSGVNREVEDIDVEPSEPNSGSLVVQGGFRWDIWRVETEAIAGRRDIRAGDWRIREVIQQHQNRCTRDLVAEMFWQIHWCVTAKSKKSDGVEQTHWCAANIQTKETTGAYGM